MPPCMGHHGFSINIPPEYLWHQRHQKWPRAIIRAKWQVNKWLATVTTSQDRVECALFKTVIDASRDTPDSRTPCPTCGGLRRTIHVSITETVTARAGISVKAKRQGQSRPYIEDRGMPCYSASRGKTVLREQVIDRDNDRYFERVTDYDTGEVIHECEEPLSEHRGHGTAKPKRSKDGA